MRFECPLSLLGLICKLCGGCSLSGLLIIFFLFLLLWWKVLKASHVYNQLLLQVPSHCYMSKPLFFWLMFNTDSRKPSLQSFLTSVLMSKQLLYEMIDFHHDYCSLMCKWEALWDTCSCDRNKAASLSIAQVQVWNLSLSLYFFSLNSLTLWRWRCLKLIIICTICSTNKWQVVTQCVFFCVSWSCELWKWCGCCC